MFSEHGVFTGADSGGGGGIGGDVGNEDDNVGCLSFVGHEACVSQKLSFCLQLISKSLNDDDHII